MERQQVSNRDFARTDLGFQEACKLANVAPTIRQASKYRNRRGAAYEAHRRKPIVSQE